MVIAVVAIVAILAVVIGGVVVVGALSLNTVQNVSISSASPGLGADLPFGVPGVTIPPTGSVLAPPSPTSHATTPPLETSAPFETAAPLEPTFPVGSLEPTTVPPSVPVTATTAPTTPPTVAPTATVGLIPVVDLEHAPSTLPADTPVTVGVDWCATTEGKRAGTRDPATTFSLLVDGVATTIEPQLADNSDAFNKGQCLTEKWFYLDLPSGMSAGTHTFDITWYWKGEVLEDGRSTVSIVFV